MENSKMETAKKVTSVVFGISVLIFAVIAILGIWGVVDEDITMKALGTLVVILIATFVSSLILNNLSKGK